MSSENLALTQSAVKPPRWPWWPLPVVAAALVFVAALGGEVLCWGDRQYLHDSAIEETTCLLERLEWVLSTRHLDAYAPLHRIGYWIQMSLWHLTARGYHLVSVALHAANGLLVYAIARRLGLGRFPSLIASLLFVVHPTRVEVVAWISGQRDLGAAFFALLGLLAYVPVLTASAIPPRGRLAVVTLCFALAILCDPAAVAFPLLLLLLDLAWRRPLRRAAVEKLPLLALSGVLAVLNLPAGAQGMDESWASRAAAVLQAPGLYVERVVWPLRYSPRWWLEGQDGLAAWSSALGAAVLVACGYGAWRLVRAGRPRTALLVFAWPLACMLPVAANAVPVPVAVADRHLYLALVGPLLALAEWASRSEIAEGLARSLPRRRRLAWGIGPAVLLLVLGVVSQRQVAVFRDDESLWQTALEVQPSNPEARARFAESLLQPEADDDERPEALLARARRALDVLRAAAGDPGGRPRVLPILCEVLTVLGRHEEGARVLEEALEWTRRHGPRIEVALCHARHLGATGRYREAHDALRAYEPRSATETDRILMAHADLCLDADDFAGFLEWSEKLLAFRPLDSRLWYNREVAARILGDEEELERCKRRLDEILPPSPFRIRDVAAVPAAEPATAPR